MTLDPLLLRFTGNFLFSFYFLFLFLPDRLTLYSKKLVTRNKQLTRGALVIFSVFPSVLPLKNDNKVLASNGIFLPTVVRVSTKEFYHLYSTTQVKILNLLILLTPLSHWPTEVQIDVQILRGDGYHDKVLCRVGCENR